ncbi:MAG: acyltransferase family protein [Prevotella sp.]
MEKNKTTSRILSIDILRGLTIAGMITVNNPGSWSYMYAPLEHAEWNGLTPTDLVYPFFMCVMGMCIYIAMRKFDFACNRATVYKIVKRMVLIYLVGLAIVWFSAFCRRWNNPQEGADFFSQLWYMVWSFDKLRLTGVLARLAVCYGITALLAITVRHKHLPYIIVGLLLAYFVILMAGNGFAYDETNILSIVDRAVLTDAHMYHDNGIDPEGLLSTLPSIAHTLLGFIIGSLLFRKADAGAQQLDARTNITLTKVVPLFVVGTSLLFAGYLLSYGCPINKKVWSPTFVLVTCGLASMLLALLTWIIDVKGKKSWSKFFEVFGVNPLFLFVLSDFFAIVFGAFTFPVGDKQMNVVGFVYSQLLSPVFGEYGGSLVYSLLFIALNWVIGYQLYKRKIYIKL